MIAATPIPLSPRDLELLAAFILAGFDLHAFAASTSLQPLELLDFVESAPIRARLRSIKAFTDLADHLAASRPRRSALLALHDLLASTRDPIERRRAATAILRFSSPPSPRAPQPSRPASSSRLSGTPGLEPSPHADHHPALPDVHPSPLRADQDPHTLVASIAEAACRGDPATAISLIRDTLAPDALLNHAPPPTDPLQLSARCDDHSPVAPLRDALALVTLDAHGDDLAATHTALILHSSGRAFRLVLNIARANTRRWHISSLTIEPVTLDSG